MQPKNQIKSLTDLRICKNSVSSEEENDSCQCPPEYYCAYICGEDYSINTPISWQHFPRSTSSRSRCDDTSEEILDKTVSESTRVQLTVEEEKEESKKSSTNEYPITKSFAQLRAQHYLEIRHIFEFLNFLISHLVCNEPEEPVQFLVELLEKCLRYRDSFGEPPLLFTHNHIKSLYTAFDPFERGYLTLEQYQEAMRSLGLEGSITPYNKQPPLNDKGHIEETFFVSESERCLIENLKRMLKIPKHWEESRFLWKKRMQKEALQPFEKDSELHDGIEDRAGKVEENYCNCAHSVKNTFCRCQQILETKCELEQLFLD